MILKKKTALLGISILVVFFFVIFLNFEKKTFFGSANLSWSANSEPDLEGYRIYYGTTPRTGDCPKGGYSQRKDVKNKTSHIFDDLEDGKTYYFSVTSYDAAGKESCFSQEMQKTVKISAKEKIKSLFKSFLKKD
jgi:hypothetical protein